MRSKVGLLAVGIILVSQGVVRGSEPPVAVSPGTMEMGAVVESRCPTFSWGMVPGARSYELVVYQVAEDSGDTKPILKESFPGTVDGWTPALDQCLERGGQYAWSVRAVRQEETSEWSPPSLFKVASGPSGEQFEAALQVVRDYLSQEDTETLEGQSEAAGSSSAGTATPGTGSPGDAAVAPTPRSLVAGDSDLVVNGSPVLTTATSRNLLLCAVSGGGWRYWDFGDGTVLDCSTGLIWLKNASCSDLAGTDSEGRGNWATAEAAAAALASGTCGLTDGSQAGDWRQPTIMEFCSAAAFVPLSPCPAEAAPDSLVDSSVSGSPKVVNAKGDARWSEGDAFVGVKSSIYWSSSTAFPATDVALDVYLFNGNVDTANKTNGIFYVWPVRGGQ